MNQMGIIIGQMVSLLIFHHSMCVHCHHRQHSGILSHQITGVITVHILFNQMLMIEQIIIHCQA